MNVSVKLRNLGGVAGDEIFSVAGTIVPAGTLPVDLDPAARGLQLLLEDLGGPTPLLDLTAATSPIPPGMPGTGCDLQDGWKGLTYRNRSNEVDPPTCTPGSARGLQKVRLKDRRARGGGILFRATGRRATLATPVGPVRLTIVFGADAAAGERGECGSLALLAADCRPKRGSYRCK